MSDSGLRQSGSLPFPDLPAGTVNDEMPFDHIVVVMMENHSFDNLLGDLGRTRADVDGLTFDTAGTATNSNPDRSSPPRQVSSFAVANTAQATSITQAWQATHEQINAGAMNGFVDSKHGSSEAMGYYTPEVLPFAYSLASTFTLANRWFSSVPGPTHPNRRFLLAGTAFGGIATSTAEALAAFEHPPPNGTICDLLSHHDISWANYYTDIPMTFVMPQIPAWHPLHLHRHNKFLEACRTGKLPQVSFVDPGTGKLASFADSHAALPKIVKQALDGLDPGETEEDPDDMFYGERWAHETIEAVLRSPVWPRTLLIYTYDEHGGYYDHVPPPPAVAPDDIPPKLQPRGSGDYSMYGVRVPAVVVSPYSKPGGVSNVVCDHASVLATIEHKWNLPALTNRDANAATVMDFLDPSQPPLLDPPLLQGPSETGTSGPITQTT
jgi:phospholipase C